MYRITKVLSIVTVNFFTTFVVFSQSFIGNDWSEVKQNGKGEIIFVHIKSPYISELENGIRKGICVDIMKEFIHYLESEKKVNIHLKNIDAPDNFDEFLSIIRRSSGGVFGLADVTITEERKKALSFSPPYLTNFPVLVTHNSIPKFQGEEKVFKEYVFRNAYTVKNTVLEKRVNHINSKYHLNVNIRYLPSSIEISEKIANDPSGYALIDAIFYLEALKKKNKPISFQLLRDAESEQYGIIMPRNSDWASLLKEFFERDGGFINSSRYKKIVIDNLGATGASLFLRNITPK